MTLIANIKQDIGFLSNIKILSNRFDHDRIFYSPAGSAEGFWCFTASSGQESTDDPSSERVALHAMVGDGHELVLTEENGLNEAPESLTSLTIVNVTDDSHFASDIQILSYHFGGLRYILMLPGWFPGEPHGILVTPGATREYILELASRLTVPQDLPMETRSAIAKIADPVLEECGISGRAEHIDLGRTS